MAKQTLGVRAILQEIKVAKVMGHKILLKDLEAMYGKDNVDIALAQRIVSLVNHIKAAKGG